MFRCDVASDLVGIGLRLGGRVRRGRAAKWGTTDNPVSVMRGETSLSGGVLCFFKRIAKVFRVWDFN